ncbi:hypothetical protein SAZ11_56325 [Streptomyces sp. FXJ1.4098]|nr:hypothetical protein [Streptomyces sp. FXJ1.4098]
MTMVKSAVEVALMRDTLASAGARPQIYVTVETPAAVADVDAIAAAADGLISFGGPAAALGIEISWAGLLAARSDALAGARHGTALIDTANFRLAEPETWPRRSTGCASWASTAR